MPRRSDQRSGQSHGLRLGALLTGADGEFDGLPLLEDAEARHLDARVVDENVLPVIDRDEAEALLGVEPFDSALRHANLLLLNDEVIVSTGGATESGFGSIVDARASKLLLRGNTRPATCQDEGEADG